MSKFRMFGAGNIYFRDNSIAVPTPVKGGIIQDITLDFSFSKKELFGQEQLSDLVCRAEGKLSGKAKLARIYASLIGNLFLGNAPVTGSILPVRREELTIPNTPGPYTATAANGATFRKELGVWFKATGVQLTRVAAAPTTGQYAVVETTGVYTFAEADKTLTVLVDYDYSVPAAGKSITIVNEEAQEAPYFEMIFHGTCDGQSMMVDFYKCTSTKLSLPFKRADFMIQEFDFDVHANNMGEVGILSLPE